MCWPCQEHHLRQAVGADGVPRWEVRPQRQGRQPKLPKEIPGLLKSTSGVLQVERGTGGTHVRDIKAQIRAAIEGTGYAAIFKTQDDFDRAYRTWRKARGADMSMGL